MEKFNQLFETTIQQIIEGLYTHRVEEGQDNRPITFETIVQQLNTTAPMLHLTGAMNNEEEQNVSLALEWFNLPNQTTDRITHQWAEEWFKEFGQAVQEINEEIAETE